MIALFGVCNLSVPIVAKCLRNKCKVYVLKESQVLSKPNREKSIVLVPSVDCLKRNRSILLGSNVIALVFDYVKNCEAIVDLRILDSTRRIVDSVTGALKTPQHVSEIIIKRPNTALKMLKATKVSSVSLIMTFLYRIPDSDKRAHMHDRILEILKQGNKDKLLSVLSTRKSEAAVRLRFHIEKGKMDPLFQAVANIQEGVDDDCGLPEFDWHYITKALKEPT